MLVGGFPPSLIPALRRIGILHYKKAKLRKHFQQSVFIPFVKNLCADFRFEKMIKKQFMWPRCGLDQSKYVLHLRTAKTLKAYVHTYDLRFQILIQTGFQDIEVLGINLHISLRNKKHFLAILFELSVWWSKLYIPSSLNIDLILWHTQLIVCAVKC